RDRISPLRRSKPAVRFRYLGRDTHVTHTVRRLSQLTDHAAWRFECLVDVPQRASRAIAGKLEFHGTVALCDVSRLVHAREEGRDAPRSGFLHRREAVSHLFETGVEARRQEVEVMPEFPGQFEKAAI